MTSGKVEFGLNKYSSSWFSVGPKYYNCYEGPSYQCKAEVELYIRVLEVDIILLCESLRPRYS